MTTLTLVPLNNTWINPEEIAAISVDSFNSSSAVIALRNNPIAVVIRDMTADQVIERLQKHFEPTTPEESLVIDAMNVLKHAANSFPDDCDPIRLAAGIEDIAQLLKEVKNKE